MVQTDKYNEYALIVTTEYSKALSVCIFMSRYVI